MDRSDDDRIAGEKTWTAWERGSKEKMRTAGLAQTPGNANTALPR